MTKTRQRNKTGSFFQNIFGLRDTGASPQRKKPQKKISPIQQDKCFEDFEKRLKEITAQQDVVVASNLHVLNIVKIKEKVGERWSRLSSIIQMNIEAIINRHLKRGDEVLRRSELNYVIVFADADKEQTSTRLRLISKEIIEKVFGTDALTEGFELETTAAPLTRQSMAEMTLKDVFASLDSSEHRQTFSRASFDGPPHSLEEQCATAINNTMTLLNGVKDTLTKVQTLADVKEFASILETLSPVLEDARETCRTALEQAVAAKDSNCPVGELEKILETTSNYAEALTILREQAVEKTASLQTASSTAIADKVGNGEAQEFVVDPDEYMEEETEAFDPLKNAKFSYCPIWDVKREMITTFRCELEIPSDQQVFSVKRLFSGYDLDEAHLLMDLAVLRHVVRDLQSFAVEGGRCALSVAMHFSSVSAPKNRAKVIQALGTLSEKEQKLLILEIIEIDPNTWASRISEVIGFLKPYCRAVLLRLPPRYRYLGELKQAGAFAVGHDVTDLKLREANIFDELDNLCTLADQTKIKIFLSGVNTMSLCSGAIAAGVDYIDGDIVPADAPVNIRPMTLANIYTSQIPSG